MAFGVTAVILFWLGLVALIPFWHKAADHFHYALPGRVPERVKYHGRDYIQPGPCLSSDQIARRYGPNVSMRRVGTVWGWLTRPRGMYVFADVKARVPVSLFVSGGWGDCRIRYDLSGGP